MTINLLDQLGNCNPQLFREIKGRLNKRNIAIMASLSLMTQFLYVMCFYIQLPSDDNTQYHHFSTCIEYDIQKYQCIQAIINWQKWWLELSNFLSLILFFTLILGGVYMLMSDLAQEEKRGTLNFIRLSPQSSEKILLGKLLGVPILLDLTILLTIPLHLYASREANIEFGLVVGFYVLLGVICSSFYTAAMLYTFLGGSQPWLGTFSTSLLLFPLFQLLYILLYDVDSFRNISLRWFDLPLGENIAGAYCFIVASFCALTYGIWQLLNRRFLNPNATLLSKKQSYSFVFLTNLWLLGFAWPKSTVLDLEISASYAHLFFTIPLCFLVLIGGLSPNRQTLQDWARYQVGRSKKALVQELIWGEKSPSTIAIALNLVITALIWMPYFFLFSKLNPSALSQIQVVISFVLMVNMILLASAIVQIILLTKLKKPQVWAAGIIGIILSLPPVLVQVFASLHPQESWLWLFSVAAISIKYVSNTSILLALLSQWTILTVLSFQLTRQLKKAGESTTKALLIPSIAKTSRL